MLNTKEFGALIAARRRESGMTQEAFAALLGITPQAISKWENGVGYPDVTLFPHIASALNISLDTLFGTQPETPSCAADTPKNAHPEHSTPPTIPGVPVEFCSLPPVARGSQNICYSDKPVSQITNGGDCVEFCDGSVAALDSGEVVNRGTGEIRLLPLQDAAARLPLNTDDHAPTTAKITLSPFHSLEFTGRGNAEVLIKTAPGGKGYMEMVGTPPFLRAVTHRVEQETLFLELMPIGGENAGNHNQSKADGNRVTVYLPSVAGKQLSVSISGNCNLRVDPHFSHASLGISGCGNVHGSRSKTMTLNISGCGDIRWEAVEENTSIAVSGCGNAILEEAANPHIHISGCGDVTMRKTCGNMSVSTSGCSHIAAAGELDHLDCIIGGSGELKGEQLSVGEANINLQNESSVHLGRIRSHSVEKISAKATLTVDHRGNPVGGTAHLPLK